MENFFPEDLEERIRRLEETLFPIFGLEVPDRARSEFSFVPGVDKNSEFSIRFRFALMAVIIASMCNDNGKMPAGLQFAMHELYKRIGSSIAYYQARVDAVVPDESPLSDFPFSLSEFRSRSEQFETTQIVNGLGILDGLVSAFGEEANRYLSIKQNRFGSSATFLVSVTTAKIYQNPLVSLEISALLPALIDEREDFSKALAASAIRLTNSSTHIDNQLRPKDHNSPRSLSTRDVQPKNPEGATQNLGNDRSDENAVYGFDLEEFPQAMMAIEYRPQAEYAWSKVQELPEEFQRRFLQILEAEPTGNPDVLCRELEAEHIKAMRPYDDEEANDVLQDVRTIGDAAEQEFKRAYALFSATVPLTEIVRRIESKFGPTARTRAEREAKDRAEREAARRAQLEAYERADQEAADRVQREAAKRAEEATKDDKTTFAVLLVLFLFLLFGASIIG